MTAGNDGTSTPEDDDPFGYLYADGQASGATPPSGGGGYGYPGSRSSYHQVRAVGERRYGQQAPAAQYGQASTAQYGQVPQQTQPSAHYAAPETLPGGQPPAAPGTGAPTGGRGRGPNTRGLLIGAIAVVAAVVIGISVAMVAGGSDDDGGSQAGSSPSSGASTKPSGESTKNNGSTTELPTVEAKALKLSGGTTTASDIKGAKASGGVYVAGLNAVGAKVAWNFSMDKPGKYRLYVRYGIPGVDANATLVVNGKSNTQPLGMKNFIGSPDGDWEKGWQTTWAPVTLNRGTNTVEIVCNDGNQCDANLDQLTISKAE